MRSSAPPRRSRIALLLGVAATIALAAACRASEPAAAEPVLVLEGDDAKSAQADLIAVDLQGHELFRQPTGGTDVLAALHAGTAQVAFWRTRADASRYELMVWDVHLKSLKLLTTSSARPEVAPLWSVDGSEIVSLVSSTPLVFQPDVPFTGIAQLTVSTIATGGYRTAATFDRQTPLIPMFADGRVIAGQLDPQHYVLVDAHSGVTHRQIARPGSVGFLPTNEPDVVIAMQETSMPGEVVLFALDTRTGAEIVRLGNATAGPMPPWPGRNEAVFAGGGELIAFDIVTHAIRQVGRFDDAAAALAFDPSGTFLLAARGGEPFYGTFTVAGGRLTSPIRAIPIDPSIQGRALGLVRN